MKQKLLLATLLVVLLYIALELTYAKSVLGLSWDIVVWHQLPLRGAVIACILALGLISHRYIMAQKNKCDLHEQFENLQNAITSAVFSSAPLHVKSQNLLENTIKSLPLSYIGLFHYRQDSLEAIDQKGDGFMLNKTIPQDANLSNPIEKPLLELPHKKISKHIDSFEGQTLLILSLKPSHLSKPIGFLIALFKPDMKPKNSHYETLEFLAQNCEFLLALWSKKSQIMQSNPNDTPMEHQSHLASGIKPYNKLQEVLLHELKRHKRYNTGLTLLLFGVDFYENLCNIFGKEKGESILKELSILVKNNTRSTDILGQWEEGIFGIVLSDNTFRQASALAKKLQDLINKRNFGHPVNRITCSYGISTLIEDDTIETLRNRARQALDKAQKEGGNKIEVSLATADNLAR